MAVMMRVLPPPRVLLACQNVDVRQRIALRILPDAFQVEEAGAGTQAQQRLCDESWATVITDSLELVRYIRALHCKRRPFVVFVAERDEEAVRGHALREGADECVGRRASEREIDARISTARRIAELEDVLRITLEENRRLAAIDELTRLASRRFFSRQFPREVARAARYGRPLTLILCDIDDFKRINDTAGHAAGDQVLAQFGARLMPLLRRGVDWIARIGGEEFAIVVPEVDQGAGALAERLRAAVAEKGFAAGDAPLRVTASFGVCTVASVSAKDQKLAQRMLRVADAALYRSKHEGRNRVTTTAQ